MTITFMLVEIKVDTAEKNGKIDALSKKNNY
jgi:hypothetical protein